VQPTSTFPATPAAGMALVVAATACFAALDTTTKFVGATVSVVMVMWFRYTFQAVVTGSTMWPARGRALLRTRHPGLQAARAVLLLLSSVLAFFSLQTMPLGEFTAIVMLTPLLITLLAGRALGEKASWLNWATVSGAFVGALMVIRPEGEGVEVVAMALPLALVGCNAAFQLITGKLARLEDARTSHFYTGLIGALIATLALPLAWQPPRSWQGWALLVLMGVFGTVGHFLLMLGYRRAAAATLTPWLYFQIGFATLAGWIVFAHAPDAWALTGIAVIALCGLGGQWLDQRRRQVRLAHLAGQQAD
jgi:drug/metabolite transporter (DMT)-like permease